jgi:predicted Kef-type K+ transport protein
MLVSLVGFAFLFGLVLSRLGLPPMVGFLAAGFAYNIAGLDKPEGLGLVADLGVTLLLFSIGLKLDLKGLAKAEIWGTSVTHVIGSTALFAGALFLAQWLFPVPLLELTPWAVVGLAFALSFSSTVFAVKVLEDKGDMSALYGKIAIGILVMQDIFAVGFLAVSEGKYPTLLAVTVLLLPLVRKLLFRVLDAAGHGELLVLSGLFFALAIGYEYFQLVGLKGDLGALVLGVLLARHAKATELSKALLNFKELMLVGFFLSIGMQGLPTLDMLVAALLLCLLLPLKTALYYLIVIRFGMRARTSTFASLSLANFSEFGLIVAALGVAQGWLPIEWLLVIAIAVSLSFAVAAPFSTGSEQFYRRWRNLLDPFQRATVHPRDQALDIGDARALVIGMGRIGGGAYDELAPTYDARIVGIEHDPAKVDTERARGRNVMVGDATDTDFWNSLKAGRHLELLVLAMPNHHSNLYAAHQIRNIGLACPVIAVARYPEEVEELEALGVQAFNMYAQAGAGLARYALASDGISGSPTLPGGQPAGGDGGDARAPLAYTSRSTATPSPEAP